MEDAAHSVIDECFEKSKVRSLLEPGSPLHFGAGSSTYILMPTSAIFFVLSGTLSVAVCEFIKKSDDSQDGGSHSRSGLKALLCTSLPVSSANNRCMSWSAMRCDLGSNPTHF
jgi:hypothetical protein